MQDMADEYTRMMNDPKAYAEGTYASNIRKQGRAFGKWNGRDTTQKTVGKWPNDNLPV